MDCSPAGAILIKIAAYGNNDLDPWGAAENVAVGDCAGVDWCVVGLARCGRASCCGGSAVRFRGIAVADRLPVYVGWLLLH